MMICQPMQCSGGVVYSPTQLAYLKRLPSKPWPSYKYLPMRWPDEEFEGVPFISSDEREEWGRERERERERVKRERQRKRAEKINRETAREGDREAERQKKRKNKRKGERNKACVK